MARVGFALQSALGGFGGQMCGPEEHGIRRSRRGFGMDQSTLVLASTLHERAQLQFPKFPLSRSL